VVGGGVIGRPWDANSSCRIADIKIYSAGDHQQSADVVTSKARCGWWAAAAIYAGVYDDRTA